MTYISGAVCSAISPSSPVPLLSEADWVVLMDFHVVAHQKAALTMPEDAALHSKICIFTSLDWSLDGGGVDCTNI